MKPPTREIERAVLSNGLRVVVIPDRSAPLVGVAVVYDVGFRSEPEGRTGFAHLFEHLMFQGSESVGKAEHIAIVEASGGLSNGHTMSDLTCYYEAVPVDALEVALWLEADRMGRLALNDENLRNQIDVVKEEIKVNVLNRPYGGFSWIPLPALAFDTFPNAHNGYGDFLHLEDASVEDAARFYEQYYSPSNAVLAVAGDCEPAHVFELVERYFGYIARSKKVRHPSWSEPQLSRDRHRVVHDPLVPQPAFAAAYRTPDPVKQLQEFAAYAVTASVLAEGDASRLWSRLVHRDRSVIEVNCSIGRFGGDAFMMRDPVLFEVAAFHPGVLSAAQLLSAVDEEIALLAEHGPTDDELARINAITAAAHWHGIDSVLNQALSIACLEVIHDQAELLMELPTIFGGVSAGAVAAAASNLLAQHRAVFELLPKEQS
jgi:zinc protease